LLVKRITHSNSSVKTVAITVTIGGIGYVIFLFLLQSKEIRYVFSLIKARFAKREL